MEELARALLEKSPFALAAGFLLWRLTVAHTATLSAYKEGAESTRLQRDALDNALAVLRSLESRQAQTELVLLRIESGLSR
jgi:hypothetical protein